MSEKLERWRIPGCDAVFRTRKEAEGWREQWEPENAAPVCRVYILDADEEDGKKCETCAHD